MWQYLSSLCLVLSLPALVNAQDNSWRFHWKPGQVFTYQVEHHTTVTQTVEGSTVKTSSKLKLRKRWEVQSVDAQGNATLQFSLAAMRNEQTRPNGEVLLFDSNQPDQSTPALRDQMMKFIGKPLAVVRVAPSGQVVEVKQGPAERYEAEPPFQLTLPSSPVMVDTTWKRNYTITLAPPFGTGEKYQAVQTYTCKSLKNNVATVELTTAIENQPANPTDRIPLISKLPGGTITFDTRAGRLQRAQLNITGQVENHQGPGSRYQFESTYTEEFVPSSP